MRGLLNLSVSAAPMQGDLNSPFRRFTVGRIVISAALFRGRMARVLAFGYWPEATCCWSQEFSQPGGAALMVPESAI